MVREPVRQGVQQGAHHVLVARLTYVGRAQTHGLGPESVVRQPVGADDAEAGKLAMQTINFVRSRRFQIQYQRFRAMPGNGGAHLFAGAGQMNRVKMLGKTYRQNARNPGVILIDDYTEWFHDFPLIHRKSRRPWLRQQTASTGVINSKSRHRYLRNTFSAGASNGSVCGFSFCSNKISTLPTVRSNADPLD